MPLYTDSSNIFGSIMIKRTCSGVKRYSNDKIIVLIATDLPDPVVPATSKCGIFAKSVKVGFPPISFPKASVNGFSDFLNSSVASNSFKYTSARFSLGISMPMTLSPGTTAMRTESALIDRAMSSARLITRVVLIPGAGSSSNKVTTGPGRTLTILPLMPYSSNTVSN